VLQAGRRAATIRGVHDRKYFAPSELVLRDAWEANAADFVAWVRKPMHDSYWLYHRAQFLDLLPPPGELTLDIGCGEGRLARDLVALGHRVIAIDGSATMVANARVADPGMDVRLADAAALPLADAMADLAIAFMSFQDVDEMPGAVAEAARVLKPGSRFCMAIVHPLNSAGRFAGSEPDSPFVIAGSYLEPFGYVDEVERDGLKMAFASAHRPLQDYVAALAAAGFLIERLREPEIPEAAITAESQRRWQRVPLFLHIRAVRG
jgi:SAM-dependent methyltransferase